MVRCVVITRRTFLFMFCYRLLAAPPEDTNFESAPLNFCRRRISQKQQTRKRGVAMKKLYWGDFVRLVKRIARWLLKKQLRRKKFLMRPDDISRSGLAELISELNHNNIVMVEIGSYRGESAEIFLETNKVANSSQTPFIFLNAERAP